MIARVVSNGNSKVADGISPRQVLQGDPRHLVIVLNLLVAVVFLALLPLVWKRLPPAIAMFTVVTIVAHVVVTWVSLGGLRADEVVDLVTLAAGHDLEHDGMAFARSVHEQTGGNPFFVGEMLRHLAESGAIARVGGRWVTGQSDAELPLPQGLQEVVRRRVATLPGDASEVLTAAAVIGSDLSLDVLARLLGRAEDDLIDALDAAVGAHLLVETGIGRYRFAHSIVGATLRAGLSRARRARLHGAVAEAIEAVHAGSLDDVASDLAHHWGEAGPVAAREHGAGHATRAALSVSRRPPGVPRGSRLARTR